MPPVKGKIGVLAEAHFDETEDRRSGEFFPEQGHAVEYLSHLCAQKELTFDGNDTIPGAVEPFMTVFVQELVGR
jgi:hypothetical protein